METVGTWFSKLSVLQPLQGCPGCGGRRRAELGSWAGGASGNLGGRRGLYFAVLESNTGPKTVNRKLFSLPYLPAFLGNNLGCLGFFNLFLFKKKKYTPHKQKEPSYVRLMPSWFPRQVLKTGLAFPAEEEARPESKGCWAHADLQKLCGAQ